MKKGFVIGFIIGLLFVGMPVFAAEMYFDTIKIAVNGYDIKGHNILFDNRTYVPLREIAEVLDKDVRWESDTNTVHITDKLMPDGFVWEGD